MVEENVEEVKSVKEEVKVVEVESVKEEEVKVVEVESVKEEEVVVVESVKEVVVHGVEVFCACLTEQLSLLHCNRMLPVVESMIHEDCTLVDGMEEQEGHCHSDEEQSSSKLGRSLSDALDCRVSTSLSRERTCNLSWCEGA